MLGKALGISEQGRPGHGRASRAGRPRGVRCRPGTPGRGGGHWRGRWAFFQRAGRPSGDATPARMGSSGCSGTYDSGAATGWRRPWPNLPRGGGRAGGPARLVLPGDGRRATGDLPARLVLPRRRAAYRSLGSGRGGQRAGQHGAVRGATGTTQAPGGLARGPGNLPRLRPRPGRPGSASSHQGARCGGGRRIRAARWVLRESLSSASRRQRTCRSNALSSWGGAGGAADGRIRGRRPIVLGEAVTGCARSATAGAACRGADRDSAALAASSPPGPGLIRKALDLAAPSAALGRGGALAGLATATGAEGQIGRRRRPRQAMQILRADTER